MVATNRSFLSRHWNAASENMTIVARGTKTPILICAILLSCGVEVCLAVPGVVVVGNEVAFGPPGRIVKRSGSPVALPIWYSLVGSAFSA